MIEPILYNLLNQPITWQINGDELFSQKGGGCRIRLHSKWWFKNKFYHPLKIELSLLDKWKLHRAIKQWKVKMVKITARRLNKPAANRPRQTYTQGIAGNITPRDAARYFNANVLQDIETEIRNEMANERR